jgi:hypothetical protein
MSKRWNGQRRNQSSRACGDSLLDHAPMENRSLFSVKKRVPNPRVPEPSRMLLRQKFECKSFLNSYANNFSNLLLAAYTEVAIVIVTQHWYGVETPDGQRGWLPADQLETLP